MRTHRPLTRRISDALRRQDWFGVGIEIFAVILAVLLGLQASAWAEQRQERAYNQQMVSALATVLDRFATRGESISRDIQRMVEQFDRERAAGERPAPPVYQEVEPGKFEGERPPSSLWDAIVATGVANRLSADRLLRLTLFFDRADSFGERYLRYNRFSEERILPYLDRPERFYGPDGRLDPQVAAHVGQMRAIGRSAKAMSSQARDLSREIGAGEFANHD
ncbi:MAG: hypothetical protein ACR2JJ_01530 [Sphingomicrobium sp.]